VFLVDIDRAYAQARAQAKVSASLVPSSNVFVFAVLLWEVPQEDQS
jgi:hypothetical protein